MKGRNKIRILALTVMMGLITVGCGASDKGALMEMAVETAADDAASYVSDDIYSGTTEEAKLNSSGTPDENGAEVEIQDSQRKLIKNVDLQVETETFEDLLATVEDKTLRSGGYIEQSYTYNGSSFYGGGTRNASLTIRIPAERLDEFLSAVAEISNVITRNERVTDVTLQYVDLESHKKALLAEQDRLLELLEKAETIEDIIMLESRLSEVRYQIESMEAQLRTMDNQVSYSTVNLDINEVEKLTPVKEQTAWQKIATGFSNSMHNVLSGIKDFGIGLIIILPYLALWAVIILIIVLVTLLIIKRGKNKTQKMMESLMHETTEQQMADNDEIKRK